MTKQMSILPIALIAFAILGLVGLLAAQVPLTLPKQAPKAPPPQAPPAEPAQAPVNAPVYPQLPPLTRHALLHNEATYIHGWLSTHDTSNCKWTCPDGQTRYDCEDGPGPHLFAAVIEGAKTITAYFVDPTYGIQHTYGDGCKNPNDWHFAHP